MTRHLDTSGCITNANYDGIRIAGNSGSPLVGYVPMSVTSAPAAGLTFSYTASSLLSQPNEIK